MLADLAIGPNVMVRKKPLYTRLHYFAEFRWVPNRRLADVEHVALARGN